jgi:hypothetical protein
MHANPDAFSRAAPALAAALLLSACAAFSPVTPGMTGDQVAARLGRPTRVLPMHWGTRWQYAAGQQAIMVDLDAAGRVISARQVLNASDFARIEIGQWTRARVQSEFGPPAKVDRVASWAGDIMTYRWREFEDLLFWVYLDQNDVVQRTGQGLDLSRDPPHDRF